MDTLAAASRRSVFGYLEDKMWSNPLFWWPKSGQLCTPNKSVFGMFSKANELLLNVLLQTNASLLAAAWGLFVLQQDTSAGGACTFCGEWTSLASLSGKGVNTHRNTYAECQTIARRCWLKCWSVQSRMRWFLLVANWKPSPKYGHFRALT